MRGKTPHLTLDLAAAAVVGFAAANIATRGAAGAAAPAATAEEDDEDEDDPNAGVTIEAVTTHNYSPFCRCATAIKFDMFITRGHAQFLTRRLRERPKRRFLKYTMPNRFLWLHKNGFIFAARCRYVRKGMIQIVRKQRLLERAYGRWLR